MTASAFQQQGQTIVVPGATTAPTGVQCGAFAGYVNENYQIWNSGSVAAHLGVGMTAGAAQANAVIAIVGTPANGVPLPAGSLIVMAWPAGSYFSAITASSTASIYITPGTGL